MIPKILMTVWSNHSNKRIWFLFFTQVVKDVGKFSIRLFSLKTFVFGVLLFVASRKSPRESSPKF